MIVGFLEFDITMRLDEPVQEREAEDEAENRLDLNYNQSLKFTFEVIAISFLKMLQKSTVLLKTGPE